MKRIFEVAAELKVTTKSIIEYLGRLGYEITRNQMQTVDDEMYLALLYKFDEKRVPEFSQSRPNISELISGLKKRLIAAKSKEMTLEIIPSETPSKEAVEPEVSKEKKPAKRVPVKKEVKEKEPIQIKQIDNEGILVPITPSATVSFKYLLGKLQSVLKNITKSSVEAVDRGDFEAARIPLERFISISKLYTKLKEIEQEWVQIFGDITTDEAAKEPFKEPEEKIIEKPIEKIGEKPTQQVIDKKTSVSPTKETVSKLPSPLPLGTLTPSGAFIIPVLKVLVELGGRTTRAEIVKRISKMMAGKFNKYDLGQKTSQPSTLRWHITLDKARVRMIKNGLLSGDAPFGVWEITLKGREMLKKEMGK